MSETIGHDGGMAALPPRGIGQGAVAFSEVEAR
jgi:hypothetical protein